MGPLLSVFINVVAPVFTLVVLGYIAGPRLNLQARTLSRTAYYFFAPAFVFSNISLTDVAAQLALRMVAYIAVVYLACAGLGFVVARLMGKSAEVTAAFVMIAVFGNVGNFGLSLTEFRLGPEALAPATVYFLAVSNLAFSISVLAASLAKGSGLQAIWTLFKTPALLAFPPAALFWLTDLEVPLFLFRISDLLGRALIPMMLLTLGVQLSDIGIPKINIDMIIASSVRLLGGPVLALLLVALFGLTGLERSTGILQASMPAAVFSSIIAIEHDIVPEFVTTTVLFSTIISLFTLTFVLLLV